MAKQFSILATDTDLKDLQEHLVLCGDVQILSSEATDDLQDLRPLTSLSVPLSRIGKDSLFCYLAPLRLPRRVMAERDSPVKVHVNLDESHLIEFWRPYYDGKIMREGRLYYQNRVTRNDEFVEKDDAFCRWADSVMRIVRLKLKRHKGFGCYVGAHALEDILAKKVTVI
jgi:hypothetical protein